MPKTTLLEAKAIIIVIVTEKRAVESTDTSEEIEVVEKSTFGTY